VLNFRNVDGHEGTVIVASKLIASSNLLATWPIAWIRLSTATSCFRQGMGLCGYGANSVGG